MGLKKHSHGYLYRAKIAPFRGPTEYGEWFGTEAALRSSMLDMTRTLGSKYYCEAKTIGCAECEVDEKPKVIASL